MYDADAKDACGKETVGCCAEVKDGWCIGERWDAEKVKDGGEREMWRGKRQMLKDG